MIILGIDQGLANCGYTVIKKDNNKIAYITSGTLRTSSKMNTEDRLKILYEKISTLIETHNVEYIATERIYMRHTSRSKQMLMTNMVSGIIYLAAAMNEVQLETYSPKTIKKQLTNKGNATKEEVQEEVEKIIDHQFKTSHEADSAAIAITCMINLNLI